MLEVVGQQCWELLANNVGSCWPTMLGVVPRTKKLFANPSRFCKPTFIDKISWEGYK